jgi:hypothetical protein
VLAPRALNRALLARQLLLERHTTNETTVLEQLVGLHAQIPSGPYVALWSRLADYTPARLSAMVADGRAVRTALMRSTVHLVTPADCAALRPVVQPVLDRDLYTNSTHGRAVRGLDTTQVVAAGLALLAEQPRTPAELGRLLQQRWPDRRPDSLAYTVRNLATLVQAPPRGIWGQAGRTRHTPATGTAAGRSPRPAPVLLRYFRAFGPASILDAQAWSGLTRLAEVVDTLRPRLRTYADVDGRELFDVADGALPDPDAEVPPRLLPEFDNVFLSHADRSRIIPGGMSFAAFSRAHGISRTTRGGLLRGNVLLDGMLQGVWRIVEHDRTHLVDIELPAAPSATGAAGLEHEGRGLLGMLDPDGHHEHTVRITIRS